MSFASFMAEALYHPEDGYYANGDRMIGRHGDFYTSVSVGSLLGVLLAWRFARWSRSLPPGPIQWVEAGAHDGTLAADILAWLSEFEPDLAGRLTYVIAEPTAALAARQRSKLSGFGPKVNWVRTLEELPPASVRGVIFSNELLDAMPLHRFGWDRERACWFEWGVGESSGTAGSFGWARLADTPALRWFASWSHSAGMHLPALPPMLPDPFGLGEPLPKALLEQLPDGFTFETSRDALDWWAMAASRLEVGSLITIDYGLEIEELLHPSRRNGTARAYRKHQLVDDLLSAPGTQDLTAHINLSAIRTAGERAGLASEPVVPQETFLVRTLRDASAGTGTGKENTPRWLAGHMETLRTLTHPGHLGRAFKVIVQKREPAEMLAKTQPTL